MSNDLRSTNSKSHALTLLMLLICGCTSLRLVPHTSTILHTGRDPDRLYAAAVRVLVQRGLGLQARDPVARVVETQTIDDPADNGIVSYSYRIIVTHDELEVFTSCRVNKGLTYEPSPRDQRPVEVVEWERELAQDILREADRL